MFSDYHVHSSFSFDSEESPRAIVEKAIALGMKQICFTDHQDFNWPIEGESPYIDFPKYFEALNSLRNEYSSKINILKGVELGLLLTIFLCAISFFIPTILILSLAPVILLTKWILIMQSFGKEKMTVTVLNFILKLC